MKKFFLLLLIITSSLFIISCSKSNDTNNNTGGGGGGGGNPGTCDTVNMRFSANIVPIIQSNCYACHSTANQSISNISLQGYANVKAKVDDGKLLGAITHASGFVPMPQGGAKLSDCDINKIRSWITRGAQDN